MLASTWNYQQNEHCNICNIASKKEEWEWGLGFGDLELPCVTQVDLNLASYLSEPSEC